MLRIFQTLLLWLLMAALPIQGMAAVVKASCGPARHNSMAIVVMTHTHSHDHDVMAHRHADQAVVDHHHLDQASPGPDEAMSDFQHTHKSSYCSACAACCFGAVAPPPAMSWKPDPGFHLADVLPFLDLFAGHIPPRLERPPRHLSA